MITLVERRSQCVGDRWWNWLQFAAAKSAMRRQSNSARPVTQ